MGQHLGFPGTDAVGIGLDLGQACRRLHDCEGARIAGQGPAIGAAADEGPFVGGDIAYGAVPEVVVVAINQLHRLGLHARLAQILQAVGVEALDVDGRFLAVEIVPVQQRHHGVFEWVLTRSAAVGNGLLVVPVRVLGLGVDGNRAACRLAPGECDIDHILCADQWQLSVPFAGAVGAVVQRGAAKQRAQLMQGEVRDGPVAGVVLAIDHQSLQHRLLIVRVDAVAQVLRGAVGGNGRVLHVDQHAGRVALAARHIGIDLGDLGDIGAVAEPGVVACHQLAVAAQVHVQLDHVGTGIDGFLIRHLCLLGVQARIAAVGDDLGLLAVQRQKLRCRCRRRAVSTATGAQGKGGKQGQSKDGVAGMGHGFRHGWRSPHACGC